VLLGLLRWVGALVLVAAAGLVGWRVLGPAEVLSPVAAPLPAALTSSPGVTGKTSQAPLIVDGQVRVYASKRQIRADAPVSAKTVYTAVWSYRRWPQQLSGVVAVGPIVVSQWSDGDVVAIDGRSGRIRWRVSGPPPGGFTGHRTGTATVWDPVGLRVGGSHTVVVTVGSRLSAYEAGTGTRRWTATCADAFTTAGGQVVCAAGAFDLVTGAAAGGFPSGPATPLGCGVARSSCAGLRDSAGRGWLVGGPAPRRVAALDRPGSTTAGGLVFYSDAAGLHSVTASGAPVRDYPAGSVVLGAAAGRVLLLTADRRLVSTGAGPSPVAFPLAVGTERLNWKPGRWQVADHHVAIERLTVDGPADPDTPGYYFTVETVILAAF
jgi:putative pyrroloquinoline-quinone binding quinoprotein